MELCYSGQQLKLGGVMLRWKMFFKNGWYATVSLGFTGMVVGGALLAYFAMQLPDVDALQEVKLQEPMRIYTHNGLLINQYGEKHRIPVQYEQVPEDLIHAILATEDQRFFEHGGVDFLGLLRAVKSVVSSGRKSQGASTITMQVARNFFLSRQKSYTRKIREILLAIEIDRKLSKQKVLELYLNKIFFGHRSYGIAAAARYYYGTTVDQLTLPQMAMLAGLPQSPSRHNPVSNPMRAKDRRDHVLDRMLENNYIDQLTHDAAVNAPLTASRHRPEIEVRAPYIAEMVRAALVAQFGDSAYTRGLQVYTTLDAKLQRAAEKSLVDGIIAYDHRHGWRTPHHNLVDELGEDDINWPQGLTKLTSQRDLQPAAILAVDEDHLNVITAAPQVISVARSGFAWALSATEAGWRLAKPRAADAVFHRGDVVWLQGNEKAGWQLLQLPEVEGAVVAMAPKTGAVLALQGGFQDSANHFNHATQAWRQPGSAFKPFIYAAALDHGFTLGSIVNDAPIVIADKGSEDSLWRPINSTHKFYGPTRVRVGLAKSRNIVSIRLLQRITPRVALDYLPKFGFSPSKHPNSLSLALGSGTVTPLQLATGYAVFANGGYRVTPHFVSRVIDQDDQVLFDERQLSEGGDTFIQSQAEAAGVWLPPAVPQTDQAGLAVPVDQPLGPRVLTPENAFLMDSALRSVVQIGTGRKAKVIGRHDLAGKTGTTNDKMDGWFAGYNPDVVTVVWMGFDQMQPLHEYGAKSALPIWIDFMRAALQGKPQHRPRIPAGIASVRIDPKTGLLAHSGQANALFEYFRKDHLPIRASESKVSVSQDQAAPAPEEAAQPADVF